MSQPTNKKRAAGKEALGKGIRSLLQNMDNDLAKPVASLQQKKQDEKTTTTERIAIKRIEVNPLQPRQDFNEQALKELSDSIAQHDVIQPITLSRLTNNTYRLISGERRLRAAKMAGLKDIPAYVRQTADDGLLELALLENLQREDLNAIEIALSMERLMEECALTQEEMAARLSKNRSTVTNYLRLLKLPPDIQVAVRSGTISMGHAKTLITLSAVDKQLYVFKEIIRQQLSVRQAEALARKVAAAGKRKPAASGNLPPVYRKAEDSLASHFSTRVRLKRNSKGSGSIVLDFYSDEELNHLLDLMMH